MKLVNLHSNKRTVYLFKRDSEGKQIITKVSDFYPYFYESSSDSNCIVKSYNNIPVRKIIGTNPSELNKNRSNSSWEADIHFTKRYLIDKVDRLEKSPIKWAMLDIEVLAPELPDVMEAKFPVSCVTVYNNFTKEYKTFYIKDYDTEYSMINAFIDYLKKESFDLLLGWNIEKFDLPYLANRFPDFCERISPISQTRYSVSCPYPAGISIIDYYNWFRNITGGREMSYKLDDIAQKYLNHESKGEFDFSKLTEDIKEKNKLDVEQLVLLEEKFKLIGYFDEVRRLAKIEWEDVLWSSRILDQLLLQEAKSQNIVLPMKPNEDRGTLEEKADYEGAYREIFKTGRFKDITKYDLSGAYPTMIKDFCLDTSNIKPQKEKNTIEIEGNNYTQNPNAILPLVVNKLLQLKDKIKGELSITDPSTPLYNDLAMKYKAIKGIVNSSYGVFGNRFFRLYDLRVASATTFLVRSLMKYVIEKIKEMGYETIYADTDSIFVNNKENINQLLNELIIEWAKINFNKEKINLEFTYEGKFDKLLLLALCRYVGYLNTDNGIKKEICGVEAKRKDSTEFMKKFQEKLIDLILDGKEQEEVVEWINKKKEEIKGVPLEDIAFPCKLGRPLEDYKNLPIFVRALNNTPNFDKRIGDNYYWIYVISQGQDEKGKPKNVMAFDKKHQDHIDDVDWDLIIERNITMKAEVIFQAMVWDFSKIATPKPIKIRKVKEPAKPKIDDNQTKLF